MNAENPNPYLGLRPFGREDSLLFFGRRDQTAELLDHLHGTHFLAVVGSSGCGKSSLIRAGLIPALLGGFLIEERDEWRIAEMKPGGGPLGNLAKALVKALGPAAAGRPPAAEISALWEDITQSHTRAVIDYVSPRLGEDKNLLVLVDQFEEIFAYRGLEDEQRLVELDLTLSGGASERRAIAADFVDLLVELGGRNDLPIYTVLTMRTDFLGDCDLFYGLPEAMNRGRYHVPRLSRQQLGEAIEGPARLRGAQLAPRLRDLLLNELGDRSDRLPVLEHALLRTWDHWQQDGGAGPLDLEHYKAVGGLENALEWDADRAFYSLSRAERSAAARIFKRLTDTDASYRRVRRQASLSELSEVSGLKPSDVERIVERFQEDDRHFIVRSAGADVEAGDPRFDICQESLIRRWDRLREWVDEERLSREQFVDLVKGGRRQAEGKAGPLRDPELQVALDWRRKQQPTKAWAKRYSWQDDDLEVATAYLAESEETARELALQERRRARKLARSRSFAAWAVLATVAVVVLSIAIYSIVQRRDAEKRAAAERESARAQRSIAAAKTRQALETERLLVSKTEEARVQEERAESLEEKTRLLETPQNALLLIASADSLAARGRYREAEETYRRALEIQRRLLGPNDFACALTAAKLADVLVRLGETAEAERLYRRSLRIRERSQRSGHPDVAAILGKLAGLRGGPEGEPEDREESLLRALASRQQTLGPTHPDVAQSLEDLAALYRERGWNIRAEELEQRAREIRAGLR